MILGIFEYTEDEYNRIFDLYKKGIITLPEWRDYCYSWLNELMRMNKKILDNLK